MGINTDEKRDLIPDSGKFVVDHVYYSVLVANWNHSQGGMAPIAQTWVYEGLVDTPSCCGTSKSAYAFALLVFGRGGWRKSEVHRKCFRDYKTAEGWMLTLEEFIAILRSSARFELGNAGGEC